MKPTCKPGPRFQEDKDKNNETYLRRQRRQEFRKFVGVQIRPPEDLV